MTRDPVESQIVTTLKIAIVSPNALTIDRLRTVLHGWDSTLRLTVITGGVEQLGRVADQERPDVALVEGVRDDAEELAALERLTPYFPNMAVVMLSRNQSAEFLRQGMRIGLREILPLPFVEEVLLEALGRVQQRIALTAAPKRKGKIMTFIGCKGGSGATFLAANFAYALAESGTTKVALIDLNRQFGDASLYVSDRAPVTTLADVTRQIHRLDGAFLAASMIQVLPNLGVLPAPEEPDQALHIRPEQIDALLWVAAAHYDFVVIDAGRSLDELSMRALDQAETIFPVLQLSLPYLRDAKRLLHALAALGYGRDKIKLLINRFEKSGEIAINDVTEALKHEVFRTIPNSFNAVTASVNQGVPILKLAGRDAVAKALRDMAGALVETKKDDGGWLKGLLPRR